MRIVKFRGKRLDNFEWIYGDLHHGFLTGNSYINGKELYSETVGQFTGLYDKNGTEIYEGDLVVYYASGFATIEFIAGGFHIVQEEYGFDFMGQMLATVEVVGNIHDNKEIK